MGHAVRSIVAGFLLAIASVHSADGAAPGWPSLDEQLRTDAVVSGSALEALISAHQDVSVLRPEEATDGIPVPLWLRVLWRREHPEIVYSASDPTGGYPRALRDVHRWMVTHQDLRPGLPERDGGQDLAVEVSGETRISGAQASPRSTSDIRVNVWDPQKIIAASNNVTASGAQAQHSSLDGGATWSQSSLPLQPGDAFHAYPAVEWTSDGTAWAATVGIDLTASVLQVRAYKSTDDGATWTFDATVSGMQASAEKPQLWADHSSTSPHEDNVYAIWNNGASAFMNRRTGPAGAWQAPVQVSGAETSGSAIGTAVTANAFGDVFGFWPATGNRGLFAVKSTNGGVSYGAPVQIGTTFDSLDVGVPAFNSRRALIYVSAAAYRTAGQDLVFAAWTDLTGAAGCNAPADEPGANVMSACKTRIWFSRSANGGATWSPAVMVNHQVSLNDQFNQALTVDQATGVLALVYYDTVGDPGRLKTDLWYQSSFDGGVTWTSPVKVTSAQTDETAAGADAGNQYGDYNGISGTGGTYFPSWTDRRSGGFEEIWTARLTDPDTAPLDYFTLTPCRLVDTRNAMGPNAGPALAPSADRTFVLTGACGVPAGAKALSVNLTITQPTASGFLTLFPANHLAPTAASITFVPGLTLSNNAIVSLSTDGGGGLTVKNGSAGMVHFILDVTGYFE